MDIQFIIPTKKVNYDKYEKGGKVKVAQKKEWVFIQYYFCNPRCYRKKYVDIRKKIKLIYNLI